MRKYAQLCVLAAALCSVNVFADADVPEYEMVPRNAGPLFMPARPTQDPMGPSQPMIGISYLGHFSDRGDVSNAGRFEILIPVYFVTFIFDGVPFEQYQVSSKTQSDWKLDRRSGTSPGDIGFGAKVALIQERGSIPALGVSLYVKTTTGKKADERRHTDGPAYRIDIAGGKDVYVARAKETWNAMVEHDPNLLQKIRVIANIGFLAWQQGHAKQNDVTTWGIGTQFHFRNGVRLDLDWRGYVGFQGGDSPMLIAARLTYQTHFFDFFVGGARGITRDAPDWEVSAGMEFKVPVKSPPWRIASAYDSMEPADREIWKRSTFEGWLRRTFD